MVFYAVHPRAGRVAVINAAGNIIATLIALCMDSSQPARLGVSFFFKRSSLVRRYRASLNE